MAEYQITVSVLDKHKIWMLVWFLVFFFFFAQFTLNADINNQSNEQGITEVPVQFVVFLLHVLKVWIHRTHVLQINKFWVLR